MGWFKKENFYQTMWEKEHGHIDGVHRVDKDEWTRNKSAFNRAVKIRNRLQERRKRPITNLEKAIIDDQLILMNEILSPPQFCGSHLSGVMA